MNHYWQYPMEFRWSHKKNHFEFVSTTVVSVKLDGSAIIQYKVDLLCKFEHPLGLRCRDTCLLEHVQPWKYAWPKFHFLAVVRLRHDFDEEQAVCQSLERSCRRRLHRSRRVRTNFEESTRWHLSDAFLRLRNGRTLGKKSNFCSFFISLVRLQSRWWYQAPQASNSTRFYCETALQSTTVSVLDFGLYYFFDSDLGQFAYCYTENDAVVIKDELFGKWVIFSTHVNWLLNL